MTRVRGPDGCPAFRASVPLDPGSSGATFLWGVEVSTPHEPARWGIMTELGAPDDTRRIRSFHLSATAGEPSNGAQRETYYLNQSRRLGAQKYYADAELGHADAAPTIQFSVWAPNARAVSVRVGDLWEQGNGTLVDPRKVPALSSAKRTVIRGGYIADPDADGHCHGAHPSWGPFPMTRGRDGVWVTGPEAGDFARFDHVPYMYEVTTDSGKRLLRTDLYSRCQIGSGVVRPPGEFHGSPTELDGTVGCSVVVDPDRVQAELTEDVWPETKWKKQQEFFGASPRSRLRLADLVIYELHIGALGLPARPGKPGTLEDAIALLDYLVDLGVNAVELLPLSEFGGDGAEWGYSTSHYFAIEYSGGGRDQYKWFIRACHERGMAVILDVVYNHYHHNASRAQWMFDTDRHERNSYYWYEGRPDDHAAFNAKVPAERRGFGGYVDNMSTGYAPRYWEEMVRSMFVSSALALVEEFQVDGLRVDQTTSIRSYNVLHADGRRLDNVNAFGAKLLRELTRSVRFVDPNVVLMAEDHEPWDGLTRDPDSGGLGFDAGWYADFYHHLVGDTDKGSDYAKLLRTAGLGDDRPLAMSYFAGALQATQGANKIVYHESHDEAGNGKFTERTIRVAVNGAPLIGDTRRFAEARCRFAAGVTLLSAGVPMFLFGEEVGMERPFIYGHVLEHREDLRALRATTGKSMFEFYRQLIRLRRGRVGLRSGNIDVFYVHDENRVIAFRRWGGGEEFLVIASLNNHAFDRPGYVFRSERLPWASWKEIFNSDARDYGGAGIGNWGGWLSSGPDGFACVVPANGVLVFSRTG